jgi:hypothetical protein
VTKSQISCKVLETAEGICLEKGNISGKETAVFGKLSKEYLAIFGELRYIECRFMQLKTRQTGELVWYP